MTKKIILTSEPKPELLPMHKGILQAIENYLSSSSKPFSGDLYEFILGQVEEPLLRILMKQFRNNQSKISRILGVSRGTIRRMLKKYKFIA
jgi:Fis family transcriptional regulator, factor for inversion stimulation protein